MKVNTLFVTNRDDISIEYLISKLRNHNSNYLRINSDDLNKISFEINPHGSYVCHISNEVFELDSVKSVFFRRIQSKFENSENNIDAPYLNNERKHFLEGLFLSLSQAKWINPMFATQIAERKILQLKLAKQFGLIIPKTIVTNNSIKANEFLKSNKYSIIKPVSNGLQVLTDKTYSIYTSDIDSTFFENFGKEIIFDTPVLLQEKIQNKFDIRVTIIGDTIFSVAINKLDKNEVDWRKPEIEKEYSLIQLPKDLEKILIQYHKHLNLVYSAIDLIETFDNQFIFLEINPVGEWVWLENELGLKISDCLINETL
jgi:hypothetical protein